eukprot:354196-Chlamydomonas_euryale.AAC.6
MGNNLKENHTCVVNNPLMPPVPPGPLSSVHRERVSTLAPSFCGVGITFARHAVAAARTLLVVFNLPSTASRLVFARTSTVVQCAGKSHAACPCMENDVTLFCRSKRHACTRFGVPSRRSLSPSGDFTRGLCPHDSYSSRPPHFCPSLKKGGGACVPKRFL